MSELQIYKNSTNTTYYGDPPNLRQAKTIQNPLIGLLLAATIFSKTIQAKPYLFGYNQSPWIPLRPFRNYLPSISSLWQPLPSDIYPQHNQLSTSSPQIQPPPLNQQQIIHIHELPQKNPIGDSIEAIQDHDHQKISTNHKIEDNIPLFDESNLNEIELILNDTLTTTEVDFGIEYDNEAEASDSNATEISTTQSLEDEIGDEDSSTIKRSRRTTPQTPIMRRAGSRRPVHDYIDRNVNRRRPIKRRTTTSSYDYVFDKQANRRRKRPTMKTKNRPNRRPVEKEPEFYDGDYEDDDYDDYYSIARQEETTTDTSTTQTTSGTTTTESTTVTRTEVTTQPEPTNATYGYTYGPPIQSGYGPPDQTGYGPSNGNEYISITYPPMTGPNRDVLAPLLDSLYNQYSKNSIIKRLQELLQPNNFYNNQQYDVNYPENF